MQKRWHGIGIAAALLLAACGGDGGGDSSPTPASAPKYEVTTWVAPQSDLQENTGYSGLGPPFAQLSDQTLRQVAHISVGGDALKVKFSNEYGTTPVTFDKVRIARNLGGGTIDTTSDQPLTFNGAPSVTIPAGGNVYSDVIAYPTTKLSDLSVSIYAKNAPVRTARRLGNTTSYVGSGDLTSSAAIPSPIRTNITFFMSQVVVTRSSKVNLVVALGDSITEGGGTSTTDAYNDYPDQLAKLANAGFDLAVANAGIGGNRWVKDVFGPCGLCRVDRDAINVPGVTHVILFMGINDVGYGYYYANAVKDASQIVTARQITDNIQAAIDKAKRAGLKVFVGTISPNKGTTGQFTSGQPTEIPYGGTLPYNGEQVRQDVNAFIRTNKTIDGVIDFDKVLQDSVDPLHIRVAWSADGSLHPNDVGYARMAAAVDLSLLR